MDIDTASADVEDDTMTNVDANSLPGDDVQQSMSPAPADKQLPAEAATSSHKRKHALVNTATANVKLPRSVLPLYVDNFSIPLVAFTYFSAADQCNGIAGRGTSLVRLKVVLSIDSMSNQIVQQGRH